MFLVFCIFICRPWRPTHSSDVTMFQRRSTYVMSVKHGIRRAFGGSLINFYEIHMATESVESGLYYEGGPPPDVADRINASFPNYLQKPLHRRLIVDIENDDRSVLKSIFQTRHFSRNRAYQRDTKRTSSSRFPSQHGHRRLGFPIARVEQGRRVLLWCDIFFHTAFIMIGHGTHLIHRRWREPADHRWED
jgi:hypothetical protein